MPNNNQKNTRHAEKGAALVTAILISLIVMTLAGALLLTTNMSTTNAVSATDEAQAYYAAEAGLQASLNVLRGNIAPHPNDGTKINFRNAINVATSKNPSDGMSLSRWLVYNYPTSGIPDRVTLSPSYTEATGTAFSVTGISDPDDMGHVIYYTSGAFNGGTPTTSASNAPGMPGGVTLTYTPQPSTDVTLTTNLGLGSLKFTGINNSKHIDFSATPTTLTVQVTETGPAWMGSTAPISVSITGKLRGTIDSTTNTVYVDFTAATIEIPSVGTIFTPVLTANGGGIYSFSLPADNGTYPIATTVTPGQPGRLVIKVRGYGPHGAFKNLQAMVSRYGINYDPMATFLIRGHDDSATASTIDIGSSASFIYSGIDNSLLGQPLPAFLVTNNPDYTTLSNLKTNNNLPVTGDPSMPIRLVTLPSQLSALPLFLQSTSDPVTGARAFVQQLRQQSKNQYFGCSGAPNPGCDRYFNTRAGDSQPADFGMSQPNGLFTVVDGDATLPNEGGRGLLIVTGTLTVSGSTPFEGLVLVLGDGGINRSGGGNGISLGAVVLAKFGSAGGFLNPSFTSSGSGTSTIQLDRSKVQNALLLGGVYTMAVSEF